MKTACILIAVLCSIGAAILAKAGHITVIGVPVGISFVCGVFFSLAHVEGWEDEQRKLARSAE